MTLYKEMNNTMLPPQLSEMEKIDSRILQDVVQILNYVCDAPAICRQELARKVMGVAYDCLQSLKDHKLKISSLEKELNDIREEVKNANDSVRHNEATLTDEKAPDNVADLKPQVGQPQTDPLIGATIVSSVSEDEQMEDVQSEGACSFSEDEWMEDVQSEGACSFSEDEWMEDVQSEGACSFSEDERMEDIPSKDAAGVVAECWKKPSDKKVALKTFTNRSDTEKQIEKVDQPQRNHLIGLTIVSSDLEYKVEDILGEGVFGLVAKCWKKPSNEMVALKMIKNSQHAQQAKVEAEMLDLLKASGSECHNIVTCNHSFMWNGHFCLEFKLLDVSLLDFIHSQQSLTLQEIRPILHQAAVILVFLKSVGVVHTDLKPDNIMLVDSHRQPLKIQAIDFGLALCNPEYRTGALLQSLWYRAPEVLLGAPFNHSIDMWSLGCIAAEMLRGTPLFPARDEYEMIRLIEYMIGKPPGKVLESGLYTHHFYPRTSEQQPLCWTSKAPGHCRPQMSSSECTEAMRSKLSDLVTTHFHMETEDDQEFEWDRSCFIDLVAKMLHPDPCKRITPEEILSHPFITLSHFNPLFPSSYMISSIEYMKSAYNNQFIDGGENIQRPFSKSSGTSTCDINTPINIHSGNSEEEPSLQEVFIGGARGSHHERHLDDLDYFESVSSETSSNEYISACNVRFIDGGGNTQWPFSKPSSTSTCEIIKLLNERGTSEQEPSQQKVFIGGAEGSPHEMHLEDLNHLKSVSSETDTKNMAVCSSRTFERGNPDEQPSISTTGFTNNHLTDEQKNITSIPLPRRAPTPEEFEEMNFSPDSLCSDVTAVTAQQKQLLGLLEEVKQLDLQKAEKDRRILDLERQLDKLEQHSLMNDVFITGIKIRPCSYARAVAADSEELSDQEMRSMKQQVASYLQSKGIEMDLEHIEACRPLPSKNGRPPAVIMRFTNRKWKMALLKQGRKLKGTDVYISEHLTRRNADIAWKARQLKKQGKIQKTWVTSCKIFIKLNGNPEEAKVLVVKKMEDLDNY